MSTEQQPKVRINVAPLLEAHKHLQAALQLLQSQPGVGPLITVHVGLVSAEAVLGKILQEVTAQPGLIVPPGNGIVTPPGN